MATITRGGSRYNAIKRLADFRAIPEGTERGHFGVGNLSYPIMCEWKDCGVVIFPAHSTQKFCKEHKIEQQYLRNREYYKRRLEKLKKNPQQFKLYRDKLNNKSKQLRWSKNNYCKICKKEIEMSSTWCYSCATNSRSQTLANIEKEK